MHLQEIHVRVKESNYKPWQVYLLAFSVIACFGLYYDIRLLIEALRSLEGAVTGFEWIAILAIQGVVIGFAAEFLYEQGDRYAKAGSNLFGSKDRTLVFRIGVMTGISAVITLLVPSFIRDFTEYLVIQSTGGLILLGILLVHEGSSDWNRSTELPAILAGALLALAPSFL